MGLMGRPEERYLQYIVNICAAIRAMRETGTEPHMIRMNRGMYYEVTGEYPIMYIIDVKGNRLPETLCGLDVYIDEMAPDNNMYLS